MEKCGINPNLVINPALPATNLNPPSWSLLVTRNSEIESHYGDREA